MPGRDAARLGAAGAPMRRAGERGRREGQARGAGERGRRGHERRGHAGVRAGLGSEGAGAGDAAALATRCRRGGGAARWRCGAGATEAAGGARTSLRLSRCTLYVHMTKRCAVW